MQFFEKLYRSPFGWILSRIAVIARLWSNPFMIYGIKDPKTKKFRKYTRYSTDTVFLSKRNLSIADKVWIWHHSIIDATEGIEIGEGCQIGAWVGIFTHGSESSIRLLGQQYTSIPNTARKGYTRGKVKIGAYSFIGAGARVLPGVEIGKGCLIVSGALVNKSVPDYSIVAGQPGKIIGSTIAVDEGYFEEYDFSDTYYDQGALAQIKERLKTKEKKEEYDNELDSSTFSAEL